MQTLKADPHKLAFTIVEAAAATSIGRSTLYRLIKDGSLKTVKVYGRTLIPTDALLALISGEPN